jgi:L-alanine-DL-glutamate epimerase-like enolase superfamily enzyme
MWALSIDVAGVSVHLALSAYRLALRSAFGTSHSSTSERTNALFQMRIIASDRVLAQGYGEAGLPPKKFGCYESDLDDVVAFFLAFEPHLRRVTATAAFEDPLSTCSAKYFVTMRHGSTGASEIPPVVRAVWALLNALDSFPTATFDFGYKAAHAAIELACFDAWGRYIALPLHEMLQPSVAGQTDRVVGRSFYTVGLDLAERMVDSCAFGLRHTPLLKIKLNGNCVRGAEILRRLHEACTNSGGAFMWSIDANAAWSPPAVALEYLEVLRPYAAQIFMVEQPFALFRARPGIADHHGAVSCVTDGRLVPFVTTLAECDAVAADEGVASDAHRVALAQLDEWRAWEAVKGAYAEAGMLLFADESICDAADVRALQPLVHGVNVKLEKCAGLRGALRAIDTARSLELRIWIGTMVGSLLNSTGAAQLLPLACYGDMDGALLTTPESQAFRGGMVWCEPCTGEVQLPLQGGLGCEALSVEGIAACS